MSDQSDVPATLAGKLNALLVRLDSGSLKDGSLVRLTAGAHHETWAFEAIGDRGAVPMIMRRLSPDAAPSELTIDPEIEARLMHDARACGVHVPRVYHILEPNDHLGRGFLSERIVGETVARRILRDPAFAHIRPRLAFQCGAILAHIHAVPTDRLPPLKTRLAAAQLDELYGLYLSFGGGNAVFEVAFRWLRDHLPEQAKIPRLVHGDFRNGNLIVGPDGVRAVLDWELAHLGDPAEDLGWITVNSWRFGIIDKPVGGFGSIEQMLEGYRSAGGEAFDMATVSYWRTLGSLRWGLMCRAMARPPRTGMPMTIERAMIGRRVSETELDLLDILAPEGVQ
ncbi:MAG TPA: phosphotransferase family protein [Xanthobacteraceae bacterium]|nr:phosphotransferase family protein [Xanthobacteraceae bacterium]